MPAFYVWLNYWKYDCRRSLGHDQEKQNKTKRKSKGREERSLEGNRNNAKRDDIFRKTKTKTKQNPCSTFFKNGKEACHEIGKVNSQSGSKYSNGMTRAQIPGSARNNAVHWAGEAEDHGIRSTQRFWRWVPIGESERKEVSCGQSSTPLVRAWIRQHPTKKARAGPFLWADSPAAQRASRGSDPVC